MSLNHYLVGNQVVMVNTCDVRDPLTGDLTPTNPTTVTFIRVRESGTTEYQLGDPEVDIPEVGTTTCTVTADQEGREKWRCETTGACESASEREFDVLPSAVLA